MASSETRNEVDSLSRKIDAVFDSLGLCDKHNVISFQEMFDEYVRDGDIPDSVTKVKHIIDNIINDFSGPHGESKFLTGQRFVEAFTYSKTFEESEFEKIRHQVGEEMLWIDISDFLYLVLVSQNKIIYSVGKPVFNKMRRLVQTLWPVLKEKVRNSLLDSLSPSDPVPDWSKYAASLQSSLDAAVASGNSTSDGHHVQCPLTADMKKVMVDEVNSLNLDPRIKQQFAFDLKVLQNKDLLYWRDRVDCLRFVSSCVAVSTPEQTVAETPIQATEEKPDEKLLQVVKNISSMQETVNHNVLFLVKLLEEKMNDDSSSAICKDLQHLSQGMTGVERSLEQIHLHQQECNSGVEESRKRLEALAAISKIEKSSLSAVQDQVKKLDGTVNPIRRTVEKLAVEVEKNTTFLKRLADKMNASTASVSHPSLVPDWIKKHQASNFETRLK